MTWSWGRWNIGRISGKKYPVRGLIFVLENPGKQNIAMNKHKQKLIENIYRMCVCVCDVVWMCDGVRDIPGYRAKLHVPMPWMHHVASSTACVLRDGSMSPRTRRIDPALGRSKRTAYAMQAIQEQRFTANMSVIGKPNAIYTKNS